MDDLAKKYKEVSPNLRDVSSQASITATSSQISHPASGVLENSPQSYWQSNGGQPHILTVQFGKLVDIHEIWFFFNYESDESYTPSRIEISMGTGSHDLVKCQELEMQEPTGWVKSSNLNGIKCHMITLKVLENHMGGKDTMLRGLRIYSSRRSESAFAFGKQ